MNMTQTELQAPQAQVRDKNAGLKWSLTSCTCSPEMLSYLQVPGTRGSRPLEMAASMHITAVSKFKHNIRCFLADIHYTFRRRLHLLMLMTDEPIALHRRSRVNGSHLFVRRLNAGLKEHRRFVKQPSYICRSSWKLINKDSNIKTLLSFKRRSIILYA